jgi:hypothetical protein
MCETPWQRSRLLALLDQSENARQKLQRVFVQEDHGEDYRQEVHRELLVQLHQVFPERAFELRIYP